MKILLIQTAFIGDVVLVTPLIEKLKARHPECLIDILVRKGNESLLYEHPHVHKILTFDKKHKFKSLIWLIKDMRSESYDYTINVHRFLTTGLLTLFSGAQVKIGFNKNPLSWFFTEKVRHVISKDFLVHEIDRNLQLIHRLADSSFERPVLYPSEADLKIVPSEGEYICIAPASTWYTKRWPMEKWSELIRKISQRYTIFLIGGPEDVSLCQSIKAAAGSHNVIISAGKLTFLQSAALIKHAKMTFTNDSAPAHFASAVNAPVTVIFCSTVPEFGFGPVSDKGIVAQTNEKLTCRPCGLHGKRECPEHHFKCASININEILKKAEIDVENNLT